MATTRRWRSEAEGCRVGRIVGAGAGRGAGLGHGQGEGPGPGRGEGRAGAGSVLVPPHRRCLRSNSPSNSTSMDISVEKRILYLKIRQQ